MGRRQREFLRPSVADSMGLLSPGIEVTALVLEASLLVRAWLEKSFHRFPLFYSYTSFVLTISLIVFIMDYIAARQYVEFYWFCLMVMWIAEFAVLAEGSDHIFAPYPRIRRLGRLVTVLVCSTFFFTSMLPSLLRPQSRAIALLNFTGSASLTKAVLIVVLLAAARLYQLPLGKNISGMLLGFAAYLAVNVANMGLAEMYGREVYGPIFAVVGPLSFVLGLTIWNVALWRYEPVVAVPRTLRDGVKGAPSTDSEGLERYNTELMRLFRR